MAIHPQIPGLSVTIFVKDSPAPEFQPPAGNTLQPEVEGLPAFHRYIECHTKLRYSIQFRLAGAFDFGSTSDALSCDVFIDGRAFNDITIQKPIAEFMDSILVLEYSRLVEGGRSSRQLHSTSHFGMLDSTSVKALELL
ncbi:hypothetical protein NW762_012878 [Fusarium torreyae]|uniref:DUF7918 domain-containing protein n=1 Tax=Fusarium torreyae TaxID=1237075 RepID=A0A9W8VB00_9HYPO|nr:hypothetical protein NW762_012878 [Fusarium torreyae]